MNTLLNTTFYLHAAKGVIGKDTIDESNDTFDMKLDTNGANDQITAFDNHHCKELNSSFDVSFSEIYIPWPYGQDRKVRLVRKRKLNDKYTFKGTFCWEKLCNSSCQKQRYTGGTCAIQKMCYCYIVCLAPQAPNAEV